jgi:hypothetical protein
MTGADCLKLHHVGYLTNIVMIHGTTNIKKTADADASVCLLTGTNRAMRKFASRHLSYRELIKMGNENLRIMSFSSGR